MDDLGEMHWVVAPNRFHHLFVGDFAAAYSDARLLCCPGLREKRSAIWAFRFLVRDRDKLHERIETILGWDFDRLVVTHGNNVESGAEDAVARALGVL